MFHDNQKSFWDLLSEDCDEKGQNSQSFHDRTSSEELNIEFRINGCQKIDVLIKTKHDKRPRSRSVDFLAVTFL